MKLPFHTLFHSIHRNTCVVLPYAALIYSVGALLGCDAPTSNDFDAATEKPAALDAESGKERFNAYSFQQGELTPTKNPYDMAINGAGLFVLANQDRKIFFRRPAAFLHDAKGHFILGNPETRLQGIKLWDESSPYLDTPPSRSDTSTVKADRLTSIHLPFQMRIPPKATTGISFLGNLPANSHATGSIIYSQRFLHHAEKEDLVISLVSSTGEELGIQPGDVLTISVTHKGVSEFTTMTITDSTTVGDVAKGLQTFLRGASVGAGMATTVEPITLTDDFDLRGALTIYGNTSPIENLQITSDRPISSPKVTKSFSVPSTLLAGTVKLEVTTDRLRSPAKAGHTAADSDKLEELFDTNGNILGLQDGDEINISGTIGGIPANHVAPLTYQIGDKATTMRELLDRLKDNFKLPDRDGTSNNHLSVSLNEAHTYDNIPDGSIVIRGLPGTTFSLGSVVVSSNNFDNASPTPNNFNSNMNATVLREATDAQGKIGNATVYDSLGIGHNLYVSFTASTIPGKWLWKAGIENTDGTWTNPSGTVTFNSYAQMHTWTPDPGSRYLEQTKASKSTGLASTLKIDFAIPVQGLSQFAEAPRNWSLFDQFLNMHQNGYPSGVLSGISIDAFGMVRGTFSNRYSCVLYHIPLADFPNKQGLKTVGPNSFIESAASGAPVYLTESSALYGSLFASHIEASPQ